MCNEVDPLPFVFLAVLVFGAIQAGAYALLRSARPRPQIRGIGEVKGSDFNAAPIPKINRKSKK